MPIKSSTIVSSVSGKIGAHIFSSSGEKVRVTKNIKHSYKYSNARTIQTQAFNAAVAAWNNLSYDEKKALFDAQKGSLSAFNQFLKDNIFSGYGPGNYSISKLYLNDDINNERLKQFCRNAKKGYFICPNDFYFTKVNESVDFHLSYGSFVVGLFHNGFLWDLDRVYDAINSQVGTFHYHNSNPIYFYYDPKALATDFIQMHMMPNAHEGVCDFLVRIDFTVYPIPS